MTISYNELGARRVMRHSQDRRLTTRVVLALTACGFGSVSVGCLPTTRRVQMDSRIQKATALEICADYEWHNLDEASPKVVRANLTFGSNGEFLIVTERSRCEYNGTTITTAIGNGTPTVSEIGRGEASPILALGLVLDAGVVDPAVGYRLVGQRVFEELADSDSITSEKSTFSDGRPCTRVRGAKRDAGSKWDLWLDERSGSPLRFELTRGGARPLRQVIVYLSLSYRN